MTQNLFSYGTLQKNEVQLELFGRALTGAKDSLAGYRIAAIEITDKSFPAKGEEKIQKTLIPAKNDEIIEGTVFELSEAELLLADRYEPENYKRTRVTLQSGKTAWIYAAADSAGTEIE